MKIVTYNIQFGLGKDDQNDLSRIARAVDGADIIALQEVERYWQHSGFVDQPEIISSILKDYFWVYGPYFDVDASKKNQDGSVTNRRRQFGNMILSKRPILSSRLFHFPKTPSNDYHNMSMGMLEGVVDQGNGKAIRIYNTHLSAKSRADRISQIDFIRQTIAQAPKNGGAWTGKGTSPFWQEDRNAPAMPVEFMLLGDFNLTAATPEYQHIITPHDEGSSFFDCWMLTGQELEEGCTFPIPDAEKCIRIDLAFVDQTMKDKIRKTRIDMEAQGSDHQPFWIELD